MGMTVANALTEAMNEHGLRNEDVASKIGVSAVQVWRYRAGRAEPNRATYDALRRDIPGFADRMDGRAVA